VLQAVRPLVSDENNVDLRRARHPVLVLRGVKPVANSVALVSGQARINKMYFVYLLNG
jgi:DNA mismatch repair ATPase MutS